MPGEIILGRGRKPRVRKLSMWLYPGQSYWIRDGYVEIAGGIKLKIIGWDRRYDEYENGEARLVYRDNKMIGSLRRYPSHNLTSLEML
jgi:putative transposase